MYAFNMYYLVDLVLGKINFKAIFEALKQFSVNFDTFWSMGISKIYFYINIILIQEI